VRRDLQLSLIDELLSHVERKTTQLADEDATIPVSNYTSPARLDGERDTAFRRFPIAVAHASELRGPGDVVVHDHTGIPLVLVRDQEGTPRAFVNACRHRGTRLVHEDAVETRKAFVCRYHAWTYDLAGRLIHVPQSAAFPNLRCEEHGLVQLPIEERFGFLWVTPGGPGRDIGGWLGPISEDLEGFSLSSHVAYRTVTSRRRCNWKLVIDAFLEGYHVRSLHRDSIYRFFLETSVFQVFDPHVRSAGARRNVRDAPNVPRESWDIRTYATVFYFLFPNTILVFHPDWVSHISMFPAGTDESVYVHRMLVPEAPADDAARQHWAKTFHLIEENVFQREDLSVAESIQTTLRSGANAAFPLGRLEHGIAVFHRGLDRAIAGTLT
jgi:phenylpropionate dioxygenase-like ring-hydroxylating dioxygenase large terminal subunit